MDPIRSMSLNVQKEGGVESIKVSKKCERNFSGLMVTETDLHFTKGIFGATHKIFSKVIRAE